MSFIEVGCAVIASTRGVAGHHRKGGPHILIIQRKPGDSYGGYWEFPGGKRRSEESLEACITREVFEEVRMGIKPTLFLGEQIYQYPGKAVKLFYYLCDWINGEPLKYDCYDLRWVKPRDLIRFCLLPADIEIVQELVNKDIYYFGCRS